MGKWLIYCHKENYQEIGRSIYHNIHLMLISRIVVKKLQKNFIHNDFSCSNHVYRNIILIHIIKHFYLEKFYRLISRSHCLFPPENHMQNPSNDDFWYQLLTPFPNLKRFFIFFWLQGIGLHCMFKVWDLLSSIVIWLLILPVLTMVAMCRGRTKIFILKRYQINRKGM